MSNLKSPLALVLNLLFKVSAFIASCIVIVFCLWVLFCSFDTEPPIKDLSIKVEDTEIGGVANAEYSFTRTRQCALKSTENITDSKGQNVYSNFLERVINGNLGTVLQKKKFKITESANPGEADFDLYLEWECPYNIVHQFVPIRLHYNAPFTIKEKK